MITALDAPANALDPDETSFVVSIRENGWFDTSVTGDEEGPGFSYTSGLWVNACQPEVIMFSIKREIAHDVFWDLYRDAQPDRANFVHRSFLLIVIDTPTLAQNAAAGLAPHQTKPA